MFPWISFCVSFSDYSTFWWFNVSFWASFWSIWLGKVSLASSGSFELVFGYTLFSILFSSYAGQFASVLILSSSILIDFTSGMTTSTWTFSAFGLFSSSIYPPYSSALPSSAYSSSSGSSPIVKGYSSTFPFFLSFFSFLINLSLSFGFSFFLSLISFLFFSDNFF